MMNCLSDRFSLRAEADDCQLIVRVDEAEMDEMGRFVGAKKQQRWLWSAIDHRSGKMLADVLAPHEDSALLKLKALLQPFGLTRVYTDAWGAYLRLLDARHHKLGKANTQKIRHYRKQFVRHENG